MEYYRKLLEVAETPADLSLLRPTADGRIDLFTDGSCHFPTQPWRLASWAVTQACSCDLADESASVVLAVSPLAGIMQSAFRAEVRAVLNAIRIAHKTAKPVRIWSDCNGVVTRVRALLQRTWWVKPNGKHADLWGEIAMLLEGMGTNNVVITKVAVYQNHTDWISGFHQWCFLHNSLVNHATKVAHLLRPHQFWAVHERFQTEFKHARYVTNQIRQVMFRIS